MSTVNVWAGAVTQSSFRVAGKADQQPTALLVSTTPDMLSHVSFPVEWDADSSTFKAAAFGLATYSRYYYAMEYSGSADLSYVSSIKTACPAGKPGGFRFVSWSCAAGTNESWPAGETIDAEVPWSTQTGARHYASNIVGFEIVAGLDVDLIVQTGDLHYWDINTNDPYWYGYALDSQFAAPRQRQCWASNAVIYMWDDHDFGPNDGNMNNQSRPAALEFYRHRVPSHTLPSDVTEPPYNSAVHGRVRVVCTDVRADREPKGSNGLIFQQQQEDWFIAELAEAVRQGQVVCWVNPKPWIAASNVGADHWGGYPTYRDHLLSRIQGTGVLSQIYAVSGDMHALAIDDGRNNQWGGFPVFQLSSMDTSGSTKGGPYWKGPNAGPNRYGVVTHHDDGDTMAVTVTGYIEEAVWDSYTHVFSLPAKVRGPSGGVFPAVPTKHGWQALHNRALSM